MMNKIILILLAVFSIPELHAELCENKVSGLRFYNKMGDENEISEKIQSMLAARVFRVHLKIRQDQIDVDIADNNCHKVTKALQKLGFNGASSITENRIDEIPANPKDLLGF